jgi:hypothetical protein
MHAGSKAEDCEIQTYLLPQPWKQCFAAHARENRLSEPVGYAKTLERRNLTDTFAPQLSIMAAISTSADSIAIWRGCIKIHTFKKFQTKMLLSQKFHALQWLKAQTYSDAHIGFIRIPSVCGKKTKARVSTMSLGDCFRGQNQMILGNKKKKTDL